MNIMAKAKILVITNDALDVSIFERSMYFLLYNFHKKIERKEPKHTSIH